MSNTYYIGWDVGGWNCEKNSKSRDAIVILDANGCKIGEAFRVNLRNYIIESKNTLDFVSNILLLGGIMVARFVLSWQLAIGTLIVLPIMIYITSLVNTHSRQAFRSVQRNLGAQPSQSASGH